MIPGMIAQDAAWMTVKESTALVGAAGEHYCMTQLLLRGCLAALTPRGSPTADILVLSPDGTIAAEVQVKARSGRSGKGWRMSQKHEDLVRPRLFYCFVDFGHEIDWPGIHGLGWVTWQYFCSLAGIDHFKPDVMLLRFAAETLGRYVSPAETDALLSRAFEELKPSHPGLTKRVLDHSIWIFERGQ